MVERMPYRDDPMKHRPYDWEALPGQQPHETRPDDPGPPRISLEINDDLNFWRGCIWGLGVSLAIAIGILIGIYSVMR